MKLIIATFSIRASAFGRRREKVSDGVALYYTLTSEFEFALLTRREGYKQSNSFDLSIDLDFEQG